MAAPIPSSEPTTLVAGDTSPWTKSLSDYPATDGWALTYAFRLQQGSGKLDLTATPSGSDYAVVIPAASSALMVPGIWVWSAYVTKAAERYQVDYGTLVVTPNLATISQQVDLRSHAKIAYDNALVAWESVKVGQSVSLNGRTYSQHNLPDLIAYVDRCRADYALEVSTETTPNPRRIGVRFNRV